uniref:serum response factor homolog A-like n=1 Tax=Epinephelus lanceolatus TaxID=310571 RepID=UPI0014475685|nr:serum response factor homolog A-like [Epinephelus lanceolatus]
MVVDYEEEIDRQRRLLDVAWKTEVRFYKIELPQQHVCKEKEVVAEQQLSVQGRNSSVDQEEPEPPEIREEEEELCSSQEGEQLEVKQETPNMVVEETPLDYILVKSFVVPEPGRDHQLLSHEAESQDQKGDKHGDSGSTRNAEQTEPDHNSKSHINKLYNPTISTINNNNKNNNNNKFYL